MNITLRLTAAFASAVITLAVAHGVASISDRDRALIAAARHGVSVHVAESAVEPTAKTVVLAQR